MKPVFTMSTDWHLKEDNIEAIKDLAHQLCKLTLKLGLKETFCLGDILDSRIAQKQVVLKALEAILDIFRDYDVKLHLIPGNHDKSVYSSKDSFLDVFKHHPSAIIYRQYTQINRGRYHIHMMPYFEEKVWIKEFKGITPISDGGRADVLLTHMAVKGSRNNDGSIVDCKLTPSYLKLWGRVYLGHYHDRQQIGKNIFHIPSIQQNNFGEDEHKGFTVFYQDGSHKLIKSDFQAYKCLKLDINDMSHKEIEELAKEHSTSSDRIRFEFLGDTSSLKSIDKVGIESLGIEVKTKSKEIEDTIKFVEEEDMVTLNKDSIMEEFKGYCKEFGKDYKRGSKFIKSHLNGKEGQK